MAAVVMTSTPKVANSSPKRVSFGEGGSLVETLIIDDDMPAAERQYYEDALMKKSASTSSSNFSGSSLSNSVLRKNDETGSQASGKSRQNGTTHRVTFAESHLEHISPDSGMNGRLLSDSYCSEDQEGEEGEEGEQASSRNCLCDNGYGDSDCGNGDAGGRPQQHGGSNGGPGYHHRHSTPHGGAPCPHGRLHHHPSSVPSSSSPSCAATSQPEHRPPPIIRLHRSHSTESHDNPFLADGELSKKADYIISHSRISRSEVKIVDPDNVSKEPPVIIEMVEKTESAPVVASEPPKSRENGQVEEVVPEAVQLEVANASQPQPETATQVKPKDKPKCQCCVVM